MSKTRPTTSPQRGTTLKDTAPVRLQAPANEGAIRLPVGARPRQAARPSVADAVGAYLARKAKGGWPVSLASAVAAVREMVPDCTIEDEDLSALVTIAAIERGCDISFDADLIRFDEPAMRRPAR